MRVLVIGGGLAGLTAAHELRRGGHEVVVLEGSNRVGGKLRRAEVAGVTVDVGAEAMLHRRPEGVELARELGLEVVHPAVSTSGLWTGGRLRPLPRTLMGVPLDTAGLTDAGVLSDEALARIAREPELGPERIDGDVSVGELVDRRLGREVTDRLVEPLLGGVYAGHARLISARAAVPQLVEYAERGSLLEQAAAAAGGPPSGDDPVFAGIPGGTARLVESLAERVVVRTGAVARELVRAGDGFEARLGSVSSAGPRGAETADAVVLATPAAPTGRLLAELAPEAARELGGVEYASMAVVTLAFPASAVSALADSSGFLVPPAEGRRIKASTFSFAKWAWVREAGDAEGVALLRASLGRHREARALQATDDELVAASLADLRDAAGIAAEPVDVHVQRWGGGLPQYAVGHLDRVARIRADVARVPGLAVCGAAYDGVGIPAVIASARRAAREVVPAQ